VLAQYYSSCSLLWYAAAYNVQHANYAEQWCGSRRSGAETQLPCIVQGGFTCTAHPLVCICIHHTWHALCCQNPSLLALHCSLTCIL
jgi:hypothetical protein